MPHARTATPPTVFNNNTSFNYTQSIAHAGNVEASLQGVHTQSTTDYYQSKQLCTFRRMIKFYYPDSSVRIQGLLKLSAQ